MWRRAYARGPKQAGKKNKALFSALRRVLGLAGTIFFCWLLLFPDLSGSAGRAINRYLFRLVGLTAYFLPIFLINGLLRYVRDPKGLAWHAGVSLLSILSLAALLSIAAGFVSSPGFQAGGALGAALMGLMSPSVGSFGATAFNLAILLFSLQSVFGIPWWTWATRLMQVLNADYRAWQASRRDLATRKALARASWSQQASLGAYEPSPPVLDTQSAEVCAQPPIPSQPRNGGAAQEARQLPSRPAGGTSYAHYQPPSTQLMGAAPQAMDRGKPLEKEIATAAVDLERTLASFGIEARVIGCAPGPVITRYELSPAPGVKVSSIVSLENDIALALKAKGIRIIAPIPGKAAVGIEIPNARPALVVLREILESAALPSSAPLLSFGLGLSSAGEPLAADLQKMPHILVAGATNSGKSVLIHSLVLSILFRARPDEVKFLMIDPKRLELTFYDGIPHLFDPTSPAASVSVITNPKDAAKSLSALVKVMERRYEEFQLFGVRNIDSYNKEADARGVRRAFFIIVIIDELADLMLIARDSVEDSIQRLTQMARAVGIHLVLATQRPSVDIITGVIKANLPCRIALQVISKIDSKVILDCSGAETLQGKGDLLYLAAGAQKPERCQGAYVSEEEISRVVEHLRRQGKPDYPLLETMAKTAEADLSSFGVDPLEFSQALKLVIERRRVSQDLLKSQFGSSARATNILSLLEVKEMIHKPEGSNRWEIHFDVIEDYLRKYFPQVPLDNR